MATLKANRGVQYGVWAEFKFNLTDNMVDVNGNTTGFNAAAGVFEPINLPPNAVVVGGDVTVETASNDTGTATVKIGDSVNDSRYLVATDMKTAARTALTLTGFRGAGQNIRMTVANANGNATQGTVSVRVHYITTGRTQEVQAT